MKRTVITIIAIGAIAAFLRLFMIASLPPGLYPDEAMNGSNALQAIETGDYKVFYPENNGREGLFINIQAIFVKLTNLNEPWVLRSAAAIFGILTVIGIYLFARELFTRKYGAEKGLFGMKKSELAAISASFLTAISFWHILFSRIGFRANMAPAFLVWSLFLLYKAWNSRKGPIWKTIALSSGGGLLFGLGFHSYIAYRAMPALILIVLIYFAIEAFREKIMPRFMGVVASFGIFTAIAIAPLGLYFIDHPADLIGRTTQVSVFASDSPMHDLGLNIIKTLGMFNIRGDENWRHNYSGAPELAPIPGFIFLVGFALAITSIFGFFSKEKRMSSEWSAITLAWFAVALLPVVVSNEGIPHALRAIIAIPAVFIFAGVGFVWLSDKLSVWLKKKRVAEITVIAAAIFLILEGYFLYFVRWGSSSHVPGAFAERYVNIAREINSLPESKKKYILVKAGGTDVNGYPMSTQTVMFMTTTFTENGRAKKNVEYMMNESDIPKSGDFSLFIIE